MITHQYAKFGGHSHCGSADTMFLVVEEQDSTCSRLNSQSKKACHINKSYPGYTRLKQQ